MAQADGTIYINTAIETDGMKAGGKEVEAAARRMAKSVSGIGESARLALQKQTDSFVRQNQMYEQQRQKVEALKAKLEEMRGQKVETKEYTSTNQEIEKLISSIKRAVEKKKELIQSGRGFQVTTEYKAAEKEVNRLDKALLDAYSRKEKFLETGGKRNSNAFKKIQYDIEKLEAQLRQVTKDKEALESSKEVKTTSLKSMEKEISNLIARLVEAEKMKNKLESEGGAYKKIDTSGIESRIANEQEKLRESGNRLGTSYEQLKQKVKGYSSSVKILEGTKKKLNTILRSTAKLLIKNAAAILGLHKQTKKSNSSFGKSLKTILKYTLGIRSMYILLNKIRTGIKEGFSNLAQYSGETNQSISSLMSALTQLKNSLATAFAPILNVVAPILTTFINLISKAVTYVGMLFAALTGKKTFDKAVGVQKNYADSLGKTASNAKDAEKALEGYLSPIDEINKMEKPDAGDIGGGTGGAGGGSGAGGMFETVPIEDSINKLAEKIKSILSGIFDVFKEAWSNKGQAVIASAKAALSSLIEAAKAVGSTFYEVFTNGTGLAWVESSLELLRSIFDIIQSIASAFTEAWNSGAGFEVVTALFNMLTNINTLLTSIGDSFSHAFSSGIGIEIWTNILGIITGVYNIVGNLAGSLDTAWNASKVGESIWSGILENLNIILSTIHEIVDSTAGWAEKLNFSPLLQSIDTILKSLSPLTQNIGDGLQWFWNNVLLPIAGWTIQEAVPSFLNMLSAAIDIVNSAIDALKPLGTWLWDSFLQPIGAWTGDLVISAMGIITDLLKKFSDWIKENQNTIEYFTIVIGSFFAAWTVVNLSTTIAGIVGALVTFITTGGLAAAAATVLGTAIGVLTSPVTAVIVIIGALIAAGVLLYKNWDTVSDFAKKTWEKIEDIMNSFAEWVINGFVTSWHDICTGLKDTLESLKTAALGIWDGIKKIFIKFDDFLGKIFATDWTKWFGVFGDVMNGFMSSVKTIWNGIKTAFNGFVTFIKGVFSGNWKQALKGLAQIFKGVFQSLIGFAKAPINTIIGLLNGLLSGFTSAINKVIDMVNQLHFDIPDWVPGIGGKSFGFDFQKINTPKIPYLATGAVIPPNAPFMAMLGDQRHGTNLEAPEALIRRIVREESGGSGKGGQYRFTAQINRRTLFDEMISEAKLIRDQNGRNPFELA